MLGIAEFPSWHAYSKICSCFSFSGTIAFHGVVQVVGSVTVTS